MCVFCGGRQTGRHVGKECSICSDNKTQNCSGHDIEEERGVRREKGGRKVWKRKEDKKKKVEEYQQERRIRELRRRNEKMRNRRI
jgi:hypothetical protein